MQPNTETFSPAKKMFSPGKLGNLKLRNRIIRAGCFEGMCQEGQVTEALIEHHRRVAEGGVAMTTVAYFSQLRRPCVWP